MSSVFFFFFFKAHVHTSLTLMHFRVYCGLKQWFFCFFFLIWPTFLYSPSLKFIAKTTLCSRERLLIRLAGFCAVFLNPLWIASFYTHCKSRMSFNKWNRNKCYQQSFSKQLSILSSPQGSSSNEDIFIFSFIKGLKSDQRAGRPCCGIPVKIYRLS